MTFRAHRLVRVGALGAAATTIAFCATASPRSAVAGSAKNGHEMMQEGVIQMHDPQDDRPASALSEAHDSAHAPSSPRRAWVVIFDDPNLLPDFVAESPDLELTPDHDDVLVSYEGERPDNGVVWIPRPPASDDSDDLRAALAYLDDAEAHRLSSAPGVSEVVDGTEKRRWLLLLGDAGEFRSSLESATPELQEQLRVPTGEDGLLSNIVFLDLDARGLAVILRSKGWIRLEPDAPVVLEDESDEDEP